MLVRLVVLPLFYTTLGKNLLNSVKSVGNAATLMFNAYNMIFWM